MVEAAATGDGGTAYALYSGSYTNSDFSTENTADNITVHAGASITGIWELGGSGKESSVDTITLLSGTGSDPGLFDYTVRTTVNTNKSDTATHHSSVTLNAGSADNKANWTISTEKAAGLVNRFNVAYGSNVTLTGDSQILRDGALVNNLGTLSGTGTLTIAKDMTLISGTLVQNAREPPWKWEPTVWTSIWTWPKTLRWEPRYSTPRIPPGSSRWTRSGRVSRTCTPPRLAALTWTTTT